MAQQARRRILIVDDEEPIRAVLGDYLSDQGFDVSLADSGETALHAIERNPGFDAIVVDGKMPEMSGMDLVRTMHERNVSTPVLFMTGYVDMMARTDMDGLDTHHFIAKPFDVDEFLERINDVLANDGEHAGRT